MQGLPMSSKRAQRRKKCHGKVRHESCGAAWAHLISLRQAGRAHGSLNVYPCEFCGGWHVGHLTSQAKRAMKERRYG